MAYSLLHNYPSVVLVSSKAVATTPVEEENSRH